MDITINNNYNMTTTSFETIVLSPSEGMHIRNTKTGTIAEGKVFLGSSTDTSIYDEVSEETYQEYLSQLQQESERLRPHHTVAEE